MSTPYDSPVAPAGIRARFIDNVNGLRLHVLEAGFETPGRPCVLLLHGFPELAWSWRKVMPALAAAGYHVIAPDQRGYGRTTGWDGGYDGDVASFRMVNLMRDAIGLVFALGYRSVAAWCALIRPDVFRSVVLMSAPFGGAPPLPFDTAGKPAPAKDPIHDALVALPRPRKHYQWHYSTRGADADMHRAPQGVHDFLRAYYHYKSADWRGNTPFPLKGWTADELAKMPTYYVMDRDVGMAATVAPYMPSADEIAANRWLSDQEMRVYSAEYERNGFQGGLQWYRCSTDPRYQTDLQIFSGRTIDVPSAFIAGRQDWGIQQRPGALERMRERACTRMTDFHLIDGAGHWVQQEQHAVVNGLLVDFIRRSA